jgi:hypothetical protein
MLPERLFVLPQSGLVAGPAERTSHVGDNLVRGQTRGLPFTTIRRPNGSLRLVYETG